MSIDFKRLAEEQQKDKTRFYLVLAGDKEFQGDSYSMMSVNGMVTAVQNYDIIKTFALKLLSKKIDEQDEIILVSGDNDGVDAVAMKLAIELDCNMYRYEADWEADGNRAGYIRNEKMFLKVSLKPNRGCILFWNGENSYTKNLIYQCYEFSVPCKVYNYVTKSWMTQQSIQDIQVAEIQRQQNFKAKRGKING